MQYTTTASDAGNPSPVRVCRKCDRALPETADYFRVSRGNLTYQCHECHRDYMKRYHAATPLVESPTVTEKRCSKCGVTKPADHFYVARGNKDGLTNHCAECMKLNARLWGNENQEHRKQKCKEWRANNDDKRREYKRKNRQRELDQKRSRYWADPVKERAKQKLYYNSERACASTRRWAKNNPEKRLAYLQSDNYKLVCKAKAHRRRARKLEAGGSFSRHDVMMQINQQRGCCWWCGKPVGNDYHVDHIIPLSRGGSNGPENIVIACAPCNLSKGAKLPHEFAGRLL